MPLGPVGLGGKPAKVKNLDATVSLQTIVKQDSLAVYSSVKRKT